METINQKSLLPELSCWVLTEGMAGTENQCLGLAEALGVTPVVKRIKLKFPWKQLSPWLCFGQALALAEGSDAITPPWPDILIASGRKSIGTALHIKKMSGGKTFLVQVQDPRIALKNFDLVAVPQHDPARGENVVVTKCALHRVTPERIAEGKNNFTELGRMASPRVAVLIGGSSKAHSMTRENAAKLAGDLLALKDARLMITASRRTGEDNVRMLRQALKGPDIFFWDGQGQNPYFAFLGYADYIIVTEDSVSMTSEALSTGKPVYTVPLEGGGGRLSLFHKMLREQGYTRQFEGKLSPWSYAPPDDIMHVATEIKKRLKEHHVQDASR